ncbi:MAG: hypothetical protein ACREBW_07885, partial [Candidatus Micrarchaeaceae archaeon]
MQFYVAGTHIGSKTIWQSHVHGPGSEHPDDTTVKARTTIADTEPPSAQPDNGRWLQYTRTHLVMQNERNKFGPKKRGPYGNVARHGSLK